MRVVRLVFVILSFCTLASPDVFAQVHRILPVGDRSYEYIQRLQRRGILLDLNPTALPYREGEIVEALDNVKEDGLSSIEQRWVRQLRSRFHVTPVGKAEIAAGLELEMGGSAVNSERRDVLRPLRNHVRGFEHLAVRAFLEHGSFIAQFGGRHDLYYDRDPDGISPVNRLKSRPEDDYIGYDGSFASVFLGRFANHWAAVDAPASVISANPRPYDQINLRFGGKRFSLRSLLGELDSITADGRFTGIAGDDSVRAGSERRYIAAHRFDWRPSPTVVVTFIESALYSGANSGLSLKYLNPFSMAILTVDNRPKNDENNGLVGGSIWVQAHRTTFFGQLMFDDFDILNRQEPASFTLIGRITRPTSPFADLGIELEIVSARTYNTAQPEGKYLFLLRGLATQFSDYLHANAFSDLYLDQVLPGLTISPRFDYLAQGESDIRQPFPPKGSPIPTLLNGIVERTYRGALRLDFQPDDWWWIGADVGVNHVTNEHAVMGRHSTHFVGQVEFGLRLSLDRAVHLDF